MLLMQPHFLRHLALNNLHPHLDIRIGNAAQIHGGQLHRLDDGHGEGLGVEIVLEFVLQLAKILFDRALNNEMLLKIRMIFSIKTPSTPPQSAPSPPPWRPILLAHRYLSVLQVLLFSSQEVARHTSQLLQQPEAGSGRTLRTLKQNIITYQQKSTEDSRPT